MVISKAMLKKIQNSCAVHNSTDLYRLCLTYKKHPGDKGSYKESNKEVLKAWWEQRKQRASPTVSPVSSDDEDDNDIKIELPDPPTINYDDLPGLELPFGHGPDIGNC